MSSIVQLEASNVAAASAFLLVNCLFSVSLKLELSNSIIVGALRCVVQLTVLATILKPVLETDSFMLVSVLAAAQILLSVGEIYHVRSRYVHSYMPITLLIGVSASSFATAVLGSIFGMILGNVMTSTAIGMSAFMASLTTAKGAIEMYLAFGASRWEALRPVAIEAIRIGLLPGINSMSIIGLISIPGMMTGQILAGEEPFNAIKYQQIIMFLICASSCLAVISCVLMACCIVVDEHARLRMDRIQKKKEWTNPLKACLPWMFK